MLNADADLQSLNSRDADHPNPIKDKVDLVGRFLRLVLGVISPGNPFPRALAIHDFLAL